MKWRLLALCLSLCVLLCFTAGCARPTEENPTNLHMPETLIAQTTSEFQPDMPAITPDEPEIILDESETAPDEPVTDITPTEPSPTELDPSVAGLTANTIRATITMEDGATIVLELYPDLAPQSVCNFVYLARQGFYDGLKFHRIMKDFMIQGGDPEGTGGGGPGYSIKGEFSSNGFTNDLKHTRGVLSMARSNDYNSAGSQFFIMHADYPSLDGAYAAFGRVISGMDVVDKLADTPNSGPNGAVAEEDKPVMKSITINDDIELPEPDMIR
jgi:peptidyl-prolyl cis-trans isomerase B (cyclophilin B)